MYTNIEREIERKKRRIAAIRDRLDSLHRTYCRAYVQTTGRNDSLADYMAELVDLENEVKKLEKNRRFAG